MSEALRIGIPIKKLRPTQMTAGFREVELKREEWRDAGRKHQPELLRKHVIPAVLGPGKVPYIVDHHHFALALLEEKAGDVAVYLLADLSHLPKPEFWTFLDNSAWCHAYDAKGRRCDLADIPKRLSQLEDDPFRSLVGSLIRVGKVAKTEKPFFEFLWADFLRNRLDHALVEGHYDKAVKLASKIAVSKAAKDLPGWCGSNDGGT